MTHHVIRKSYQNLVVKIYFSMIISRHYLLGRRITRASLYPSS